MIIHLVIKEIELKRQRMRSVRERKGEKENKGGKENGRRDDNGEKK